MKIVIAAWHLKDFNVGIGRYCRGLIGGLGQIDQENDYHILLPKHFSQLPKFPNIHYHVISIPIFKRRVWEQIASLLVGPYDVLHFPYDSVVACKRGKFVVTIHDVKPLIFNALRPDFGWNSLIQRLIIPDQKTQVDQVITVSECSRRDIVERLGFPPERISVVYPGIDRGQFCPASTEPAESGSRPYILCVAGSDPTKNVETLVEAFGRLPRPLRNAYDLMLAGDMRRRIDIRERVGQLGIDAQTRFIGVVDEAQLVTLYQRATVFVFPSRYEGFGLPVLEAMACGCPVISSNASSLPEVVGEAALLANPSDAGEFLDQLVRVLTDQRLRQSLREKGLERAAWFSWEGMARETVRVYQQLCMEI